MPNQSQPTPSESRRAPRRRRSAAAVIAQYIQDLSHPAEPVPSPAAA